MSSKIRVLVLYGTRPEVIKMAPVVEALRRRPQRFATVVCATAQHRQLLDQTQSVFDLAPDIDLDLMTHRQSLSDLAARVLQATDTVLGEQQFDWLLVQGDTTSAMAAAIAGFHRGVPVGHVEAGLRSGDLTRPFPEEANRRLIDTLATALFAPTRRAEDLLLREGADPEHVFLTGNTVVDSLLSILERQPPQERTNEVLVTAHRRESFGEGLESIVAALRELSTRFPRTRWILPVHPNPRVLGPVREALSNLRNVQLCEPLDYPELVRRLRCSRFVLTDSGGIQEEAPALGTPVLVLRESTERPEAVESGAARLVGTDFETIVEESARLLTDDRLYRQMQSSVSPYGDGHAAERIVSILAGEPWERFSPAPCTSPRRVEAASASSRPPK